MRRVLVSCLVAALLVGCSLIRPMQQDFFVVFFVPGTIQLAPEAQQIVRQAAASARAQRASKVEIGVPSDAPGGTRLVEGRITAIENILSSSGVDPKTYATRELSGPADALPAAVNRAEIRLE